VIYFWFYDFDKVKIIVILDWNGLILNLFLAYNLFHIVNLLCFYLLFNLDLVLIW